MFEYEKNFGPPYLNHLKKICFDFSLKAYLLRIRAQSKRILNNMKTNIHWNNIFNF